MRGRYALATALGLAIGCAGTPAFVCRDSDDCANGSFTGICEDNGYCSFGDPGCPSGQRFGDHAPGDLAGTCVDAEGTSTGAATTEGGATTFATLDGASVEPGTSDDSSSDRTTTGDDTTTGHSVDDTSGNSMPTTLDSTSDTMPTNCDFQGDPCNECIYESCCDQVLACATDEVCMCFFDCIAMMAMTQGQCLELCGPSQVLDELNACITVSCEMICGGG